MDHLNEPSRSPENWAEVQAAIKQIAEKDVDAALKLLRAQEIFYFQQQHSIFNQWHQGKRTKDLQDAFDVAGGRLAVIGSMFRTYLASRPIRFTHNKGIKTEPSLPPALGERILLLILTKEERVNIPGDLEEEYRGIAAKHGARYAKLWYYKQVVASAWPMLRKAGRWGILAWVAEWVSRRV